MSDPAPASVGIVADDLTSATDGAAPFLAKDYVPLISSLKAGPARVAIMSIDTNLISTEGSDR